MLAQRLNITLPYELARNFKRSVPLRKRSQFIAQAVREKLTKADLSEQLRKSALAQREIIKQIQEDFKYADAETWANLP
ncbi:MAG: hypothetical protein Q8Q86_00020 [Candidatus Daviesbacteria bacterium]|nr:hypothetical protein [Candidatus Daviesbacteria bacterium]